MIGHEPPIKRRPPNGTPLEFHTPMGVSFFRGDLVFVAFKENQTENQKLLGCLHAHVSHTQNLGR